MKIKIPDDWTCVEKSKNIIKFRKKSTYGIGSILYTVKNDPENNTFSIEVKHTPSLPQYGIVNDCMPIENTDAEILISIGKERWSN